MPNVFQIHYTQDKLRPPVNMKGGLTVVDWAGLDIYTSRIDEIMNDGGEVLQYTLPIHDYPYAVGPKPTIFYGASTRSGIPKNWYWDPANPARVVVPNYGGRLMDVRANSPFLNHVLNDYYSNFVSRKAGWRASGIMLDVTGDGYYGFQTGLTAAEKAEHGDGLRWFVRALRMLLGEDYVIVANNPWAGNIDFIDGIMVENHSPSEIGWWRDTALPRIIRKVRPRNITLNRSWADAKAWSVVKGVAAAGYSPSGGGYQLGQYDPTQILASPFADRKVWTPGGETPPPPPPPTDPCADVRAALAQANSDLTAAREIIGQQKDKLAAIRAGVAAETQRHAAAIAEALA